MKAWLNWRKTDETWVLRVCSDDEWKVVKTWERKDVDEESDLGWIHESLLTEIADLQVLGFEVLVTC